MQGFEEVTLTWKGEQYVVPAERQLMLVAKIEDALETASGEPAIVTLTKAGGPSQARLSSAFGAALRYAGADVSDEEIYLSIMADFAEQNADVAVKVQSAVLALISIIAPPLGAALRGDSPKKKNTADKD